MQTIVLAPVQTAFRRRKIYFVLHFLKTVSETLSVNLCCFMCFQIGELEFVCSLIPGSRGYFFLVDTDAGSRGIRVNDVRSAQRKKI